MFCLNHTLHNSGCLSPYSACVDWHAKMKTHFSTGLDEVLVHVCICWGRFDTVHGNITRESFIPVFTPTFEHCSLFPVCQTHSGIAQATLLALTSNCHLSFRKRENKETPKPNKKPPKRLRNSCVFLQLYRKP